MTVTKQSVGDALTQIARYSLEAYVRHQRRYQPDVDVLPGALQEPGASFVTLTRRGLLRGCIGNTQARWPLAEDVARNAVAAASRDPRFPPVVLAELTDIRLEVTVLAPPVPLLYRDYAALLLQLQPFVDGVMLTWGTHRGLLLPQVWRRIPQVTDFLEAIAYKAGIPFQELQRQPPTIEVHTFQVEHYHEPGYQEPAG